MISMTPSSSCKTGEGALALASLRDPASLFTHVTPILAFLKPTGDSVVRFVGLTLADAVDVDADARIVTDVALRNGIENEMGAPELSGVTSRDDGDVQESGLTAYPDKGAKERVLLV